MSSAAKITPVGIGGMLVTDNSTATDLPTQNAWVKVEFFDEVQQQRGGIAVDVDDDDDIVVDRRGIYEVMIPSSFIDSSQNTYELAIAVNGVPQLKTRARQSFNSAGDTRFVSPYGLLALEIGDALTLVARCTDSANQEVTVQDCAMSVKLLFLLPTV